MPESLFNKVAGISQVLQFFNFRVSSFIEDFLLISFQHKNEIKKGNTLTEFKYYFFLSIDLFDVKDFKRSLTDGGFIRKRILKRI